MPVSVLVLYIWLPILPLSAFRHLSLRPGHIRKRHIWQPSFAHPQNQKLSPLCTLHLNPLNPGEKHLSVTNNFLSALLVLMVAFWPLRAWRREWRVRMEFFLHHPLICFEFLPNATLLISELLPVSNSLQKSADTCQLHCREVPLNVSAGPCIISSGLQVLSWLHGYYTVWLSTHEQQALLSIDRRHCEFIRLVSSVAYKGLLSKHGQIGLFF